MSGARYLLLLLVFIIQLHAQEPEHSLSPRSEVWLNEGWKGFLQPDEEATADLDQPPSASSPAPSQDGQTKAVPQASPSFDDTSWKTLSVPHSWDVYHGFTGRKHGNLHGTAWYRKSFTVPDTARGRRIFIFFEGVGSFAEVWVNGQPVGEHAGGLTCFSLDITDVVTPGKPNLLAVRASHPSGIRSLPWVCGGCERAYGFSEGSQPFGLHRPVRIIITDTVRIQPFGVHIWNDSTASEEGAKAFIRTELTSMDKLPRRLLLRQSLLSPDGTLAGACESPIALAPAETPAPISSTISLNSVSLWNPGAPVLYTLRTELIDRASGIRVDALETPFGFRVVDWPSREPGTRGTLLVNGKPVFLNGTCEYQHQLGGSHAFPSEMIDARVSQMSAAGFNAFRDAHHPHDLRYNAAWDRQGLVWWTQFGAHIWFDRADFKENFKRLLTEWVRERRNSPSLFLWGLQNESMLPEDFARECTALIRQLDPTSPSQRLVTTCNGGKGSDWDVPQNWTGTYGGDPATYAEDLRTQLLVGEYGAWRSLGMHNEDPASPNGGYTEESMNLLLGTKLLLARKAAPYSIGHFQWIFSTHENPGRNTGSRGEQGADGWSRLDRLGPANNKGLLTLWGEPLDIWYLYRTHSLPASKAPTVLITGSTWPDRWTAPGQPHDLSIFSNCDEVELFNDLGASPLGRLSRPSDGSPFIFKNIAPETRVLHAVGRLAGREVARDTLLLHHLPEAPQRALALAQEPDSLPKHPGFQSFLRVNCGGPAYTDSQGRLWEADRDWSPGATWGAQSWASRFPELDPALGSIRRIHTPVTGTRDEALYQDFRYGRSSLVHRFVLPNGDYLVDLHFAEPWYGRAGVAARGWRLFDVALNGETRLHNLDLHTAAGFGRALVKSLPITIKNGLLEIDFPHCAANQAILCAIEISARSAPSSKITNSQKTQAGPSLPLPTKLGTSSLLRSTTVAPQKAERFDTGHDLYSGSNSPVASLPDELVGSEGLRPATQSSPSPAVSIEHEADLYLAIPEHPSAPGTQAATPSPAQVWVNTGKTLTQSGPGPSVFKIWMRHALAGEQIAEASLPSGSVIFLRRTLPSPKAQALEITLATPSTDAKAWTAFGRLQPGARPHGSSGPALNPLPQELGDADWLTSPPLEGHPDFSLSLRATDHIELFVGVDARITTLPDWLSGFTPHTGKASLGKNPLRLFRKRINQGDTIRLGANPVLPDGKPAPMYCVFSRLSRPVLTLPASEAIRAPLSSTSDTTATASLPQAELGTPGTSLLWRFEVGVGDRYFLVPKILPAPDATAKSVLRIELLDRDGKVLCDSQQEIAPGALPGQVRIRSCTSINAGTYHARFTHLSGPPIKIPSLSIE